MSTKGQTTLESELPEITALLETSSVISDVTSKIIDNASELVSSLKTENYQLAALSLLQLKLMLCQFQQIHNQIQICPHFKSLDNHPQKNLGMCPYSKLQRNHLQNLEQQ